VSGSPQSYSDEASATVRTVQRWEKTEKLPVRRHLHERQRRSIGSSRRLMPGASTVNFRTMKEAATTARFVRCLKTAQPENVVLAVLRFKNMGWADREPLVDGFTTETKTRLEQVQPDRMGVLLLTNKKPDLAVEKVAAEFNAGHVWQGEAKIVGQRVAISARLTRAGTRSSVSFWSDQYEGDLQDIQRIQSEVSAAIAKAVLSQIPNTPLPSSSILRPMRPITGERIS